MVSLARYTRFALIPCAYICVKRSLRRLLAQFNIVILKGALTFIKRLIGLLLLYSLRVDYGAFYGAST